MDKFRVGLSADFLDEQRKLIFPDIGLSLLEQDPHIEHRFLDEYHPEYLPSQFDGFDVMISLRPRVSRKSLAGNPRLTAIGRCGVGCDNVDLPACTENDVAVYITREAVARPMAECEVLLILALSHNLIIKDRAVREGRWYDGCSALGREPRDRVIGTVGLGNIAREMVRLIRVFTPSRILAHDPLGDPVVAASLGVELVSMEELLRLSDYVVINCPLMQETHHLIGARELAMMKPDSFLINAARGPIVDEAALIHALETRQIRGAGLDVFESEPLDASSPLTRMDNVILASHCLGWTDELFRDMGRMDCEGALAVSRGEAPRNVMNSEVLQRPGFLQKLENYKRRRSVE
ncbi:MAG: NAD(P)-dependent oxidoreductase [Bryobacteraceae bacterium]